MTLGDENTDLKGKSVEADDATVTGNVTSGLVEAEEAHINNGSGNSLAYLPEPTFSVYTDGSNYYVHDGSKITYTETDNEKFYRALHAAWDNLPSEGGAVAIGEGTFVSDQELQRNAGGGGGPVVPTLTYGMGRGTEIQFVDNGNSTGGSFQGIFCQEIPADKPQRFSNLFINDVNGVLDDPFLAFKSNENITVDNCFFEGLSSGEGIIVLEPTDESETVKDIRLINNYIDNSQNVRGILCSHQSGGTSGDGLIKDILIQGNIIKNLNWNGISVYRNTVGASVVWNDVRNVGHSGIAFSPASHSLIGFNTVSDVTQNDEAGIEVERKHQPEGETSKDNIVIANTVRNCNWGLVSRDELDGTVPPENTRFAFNTIEGCSVGAKLEHGDNIRLVENIYRDCTTDVEADAGVDWSRNGHWRVALSGTAPDATNYEVGDTVEDTDNADDVYFVYNPSSSGGVTKIGT